MSEITREMNLREEIKHLSIDETTKLRLISKLEKYECSVEEQKAMLAKQREEFLSKLEPLKEANSDLLMACEGLSKAMIAHMKANRF